MATVLHTLTLTTIYAGYKKPDIGQAVTLKDLSANLVATGVETPVSSGQYTVTYEGDSWPVYGYWYVNATVKPEYSNNSPFWLGNYGEGNAGSASYAARADYALTSTTASYAARADFALTATSASYSLTSSYAKTASYASNVPLTSSYALQANSSSYSISSSYAQYGDISSISAYAVTASHALATDNAIIAYSSSYAVSSDNSISASYSLTSSYASNVPLTASYALNANSSSYSKNTTSSSFSLTASYSVNTTTASYSITSSYSKDATSSSFALTASYANTSTSASYAFNATSASYAFNATSASYSLTSSYSVSSSHAISADLFNGKDVGSFATTGSNIFIGNEIISGSITSTYRDSLWVISNNGLPAGAKKNLTVFNNGIYLVCNENIYVTTDNGVSWSELVPPSGTGTTATIAGVGNQFIGVSTDAGTYKYSAGGWSALIDKSMWPGGFFTSDLDAIFSSDNVLWGVVNHTFGIRHMFRVVGNAWISGSGEIQPASTLATFNTTHETAGPSVVSGFTTNWFSSMYNTNNDTWDINLSTPTGQITSFGTFFGGSLYITNGGTIYEVDIYGNMVSSSATQFPQWNDRIGLVSSYNTCSISRDLGATWTSYNVGLEKTVDEFVAASDRNFVISDDLVYATSASIRLYTDRNYSLAIGKQSPPGKNEPDAGSYNTPVLDVFGNSRFTGSVNIFGDLRVQGNISTNTGSIGINWLGF